MRKLLLILALLCPLSLWANSYSTTFPATESPVCQNAGSGCVWKNGQTDALQWSNVNTTGGSPGKAFGTQSGSASPPAQYADSTAILAGSWARAQQAQGTVFVTSAPSSGNFGEVEMRLLMTLTANNITGYEINCSIVPSNPYMQLVAWTGALGGFNVLKGENGIGCANNDVLKATVDASGNFTIYKNGTVIFTYTDTTYTSGNPGMGMYLQGTGTASGYGFSAFSASDSGGASCAAATGNTSDVQTAMNACTEGGTVTIPAGTFTWTSGVTLTGKGLVIQGAGSGRIVAYDNGTEVLTVGTGTKTVTIAGYSPGFTSSVFTPGLVVDLTALGFESSYSMHGTVTSIVGSTLTLNITSTTGSGSTHRWFVSTQPSTVLINNSSSAMFAITEDTGVDTYLSGFKIKAGTGAGDGVDFNYAAGGKPIVLENCWIQQGAGDSTHFTVNGGVISNCSFDSPTFSLAPIPFHMKIDSPASGQVTWTQPSYWGSADTTGFNNTYVETSDFEAYLNAADDDDNGRVVWRYNLMNNAGFGTHGADTSNYGQRYFEYYNNTGVFNGYNDGSTFNQNWWIFVRGGSYVVHDNTLTSLVSMDYGTKSDVLMIVMNLQRNAGPNPCWGNGTTGSTDWHAPRQVGYGRITGTGTSPNSGGVSTDSVTYVGDSEPAYIWNNSTSPLPNVGTEDYGTGNTDSCTQSVLAQTANYVRLNTEYFNGSTAKPGYTPYTYPHPLVGGSPPPPTPAAPTITGQFVITGTASVN